MTEELIREYIGCYNELARLNTGFKIAISFRCKKIFEQGRQLDDIFKRAIESIVLKHELYKFDDIAKALNAGGILRYNNFGGCPWKGKNVLNFVASLVKKEKLNWKISEIKDRVIVDQQPISNKDL